jgi:hypothetical protein
MQLHQLPTSDLGVLREPVKEIRAVKLYYWHRGRNAWQGWTAHYYHDGCLHTAIESAQNFAEKKRTQGSVFYIKELPAILLVSDQLSIAVTQINSNMPLCDYTYTPNAEKATQSWRKDFRAEMAVLNIDTSIGSVVKSFEPLSSFWFKAPKIANSVITVCVSKNTDCFETLSDDELLQWKSITFSKKYLLGWSVPKLSGVNSKPVKNLMFLAKNSA